MPLGLLTKVVLLFTSVLFTIAFPSEGHILTSSALSRSMFGDVVSTSKWSQINCKLIEVWDLDDAEEADEINFEKEGNVSSYIFSSQRPVRGKTMRHRTRSKKNDFDWCDLPRKSALQLVLCSTFSKQNSAAVKT
jgi:hypothetical protein